MMRTRIIAWLARRIGAGAGLVVTCDGDRLLISNAGALEAAACAAVDRAWAARAAEVAAAAPPEPAPPAPARQQADRMPALPGVAFRMPTGHRGLIRPSALRSTECRNWLNEAAAVHGQVTLAAFPPPPPRECD